MRETRAPRLAKVMLIAAGCCALLVLSGCEGGTLAGAQQSCTSNIGAFEQEASCTGSVSTVRGSPSLRVIEVGEDLSGAYQLDATITVGSGTARAYVTDVDDQRVGGEVSAGEPLQISATVEPQSTTGDDEEGRVNLRLEVAEGEEVGDLRYEATLVKRN